MTEPMTTVTTPPASTLVPSASDDRDDLRAAPIVAADILDGAPMARSREVAELGTGLSVWLWDCTAGRFRWHFSGCDEIVHIVEGAVTVTDEEGGVVHLRAGDVAAFSAGTSAVWEVEDYVKKVAVTRVLPSDPYSRVVRALRGLAKRLLRR